MGRLLAAPPARGALRATLERLATQTWRHPITRAPVGFAGSTIERWYYAARNARHDPVACFGTAGARTPGTGAAPRAVQRACERQYQAHPSWSYQLHLDNLAVLIAEDPMLGPRPVVRHAAPVHGRSGAGPRAAHAEPERRPRRAHRREQVEVRSFEAEHVHGLWHLDFHHGSRKVLSRTGAWARPRLLGMLDDRSRLACHLQWYLEETAEALVHGLAQAIQKRAAARPADR